MQRGMMESTQILHVPLVALRKRKYWLVGSIAALLIGSMILAVVWPNNTNSRHEQRSAVGGLVCDTAIWDFGSVDAAIENELSHAFLLKNRSQNPIYIREVRSACGCMLADGYERELSPGQTTHLTANLTLPVQPGPIQKTLLVGIEGYSQEWLQLQVKGIVSVNATLYTIPARIDFGEVKHGEIKEPTIQLLRHDNSPVGPASVIGGEKILQGTSDPQSPQEGDSTVVRVRLSTAHLQIGAYSGRVTIETNHKQFPTIAIPVFATVSPADSGLVTSLLIANLHPGESREVALWSGKPDGDVPKVVAVRYKGDSTLNVVLVHGKLRSDCPKLRITCSAKNVTATIIRATATLHLQNRDKDYDIPLLAVIRSG
jgi:hypothetical protein